MPFIAPGIVRQTLDLSITSISSVLSRLMGEGFTGRVQGFVFRGKDRYFIALELKSGSVVACEIVTPWGSVVQGIEAAKLLSELFSRYQVYGYVEVRELSVTEVEIDLRYNTKALVDPETVLEILGIAPRIRSVMAKEGVVEVEIEERVVERRFRITAKKAEISVEKDKPKVEVSTKTTRVPKRVSREGIDFDRIDIGGELEKTEKWLRLLMESRFIDRIRAIEAIDKLRGIERPGLYLVYAKDREVELRIAMITLCLDEQSCRKILLGAILKEGKKVYSKVDDVLKRIEKKLRDLEVELLEVPLFKALSILSIDLSKLGIDSRICDILSKAYRSSQPVDRFIEMEVALRGELIDIYRADNLLKILSLFMQRVSDNARYIAIAMCRDEKLLIDYRPDSASICIKKANEYICDIERVAQELNSIPCEVNVFTIRS